MAATIQNQDLNNPNQGTQGQQTQVNPSIQNQAATTPSNPSGQNQANQNALGQIAQNYSGASGVQQQSDNQQITQPNVNPSQQKGSGYNNVQNFVNANQNNNLANTIGSNIQQVGQNTAANVANQQNQFQQQSAANQANTAANQQLVQNVLGGNASQYTAAGPNAAQGSQFQNLLSGVYQGPQGLANSQQIQSQAQDVGNLNQSLASAGGRQALLQRFVGNPNYNQGEQSLDTLLLGQGPQTALNQARASTAGIQNQANNAITGAQQQAAQYGSQAQQFGQQAQGQLGTYVNQQVGGLNQAAQTAQSVRDQQVAALQAAANSGTLSQDLANQLGITGGLTYGVNAGNYIAENAQKANAQNIANAQQYGNLQALGQLAGSYAPQQAQSALGQFTNPSQAGTFNAANAYNLNAPSFQQAYNSAKTAYNNVQQPAAEQLANAQQIVGLENQMKNIYNNRTGNPTVDNANYQALYNQIQQFAPGALGSKDMNANDVWGQNNLAQQQANMSAVQNLLNSQYGTTNYNITPNTPTGNS